MRTRRFSKVILLCTICLLIAGCGPGQVFGPTSTPTASPTPTATPTPTPAPGGTITGRVYLMDRDEPVHTTVYLVRDEGGELVDSIGTDENGYYIFSVEEPDTYSISVSVMKLLDTCENLRTETGGWVYQQNFDSSGLVDIRAASFPMSIAIGDEITLDCELYCD